MTHFPTHAAMAHPGEVITLQFGGYANWCGAHFWNFQDETIGLGESDDAHAGRYRNLASEVLYRVGETNGGVATYTPRMVYFEMRGGLGGTSKDGYLYGDQSGGGELPPIVTWDGDAKVIKSELNDKSAFVKQLETDWETYDDDDEDDDHQSVSSSDDDDGDGGDERRGGKRGKWGRDVDASGEKGDEDTPTDPMEALRKRMAAHLSTQDEMEASDDRMDTGKGKGSPRKQKTPKPKLTEAERTEKLKLKKEKEDAAAAALAEAASQLEKQSTGWSDFGKAAYHPRSSFLLDGVWSGVDAFAGFGEGFVWAKQNDRREEIRDAIRKWAEECDKLRGFSAMAEDLSGFGGVASVSIEEINDEYPTQPVWVYSLRPSKDSATGMPSQVTRVSSTQATADAEAARYALLNDALTTVSLANAVDAYVALSADAMVGKKVGTSALPGGFVGQQGMSRYRSSALAASFMDVSGTHWRGVGDTSAGASDMRAVARHLSQRTGGPFVSAAFVVDPTAGSLAGQGNGQGAASGSKDAEADAACRRAAAGAPLAAFAGLTPGAKGDRGVRPTHNRNSDDSDSDSDEDEPLAETYVTRGGHVVVGEGNNSSNASAHRHASAYESSLALDAALRLERYRAPRLRCVSEAPLPLPLTFPSVFGRGGATSSETPRFVSATTRLRSSASYGTTLANIRQGWQRASRSATGKAALRAWGVDDDELEETSEKLWDAQRAYGGDDDDRSSDEELEHI